MAQNVSSAFIVTLFFSHSISFFDLSLAISDQYLQSEIATALLFVLLILLTSLIYMVDFS